ncbi:uncharacterized protein LOC132181909 [Corylus avellana]|uniref:uncharacterized protein LOC132181909 n=1 Tax=Corylus avellana TaxID=13451 RepID=UPI00286C4272|nr:uncharacterized protein LOC132181909 [Corylus avellana]
MDFMDMMEQEHAPNLQEHHAETKDHPDDMAHEGKFIRKIVEGKLREVNNTYFYVTLYPVGIYSRLQATTSLLRVGADDVRKLLYDILKTSKIRMNNVDKGISMIQERLRNRRVLVILEDVDQLEQLNAIARSRDWFGPRSRIIITTRDGQLLKALEVDGFNLEASDKVKFTADFGFGLIVKKIGVSIIYGTVIDGKMIHYASTSIKDVIVLTQDGDWVAVKSKRGLGDDEAESSHGHFDHEQEAED